MDKCTHTHTHTYLWLFRLNWNHTHAFHLLYWIFFLLRTHIHEISMLGKHKQGPSVIINVLFLYHCVAQLLEWREWSGWSGVHYAGMNHCWCLCKCVCVSLCVWARVCVSDECLLFKRRLSHPLWPHSHLGPGCWDRRDLFSASGERGLWGEYGWKLWNAGGGSIFRLEKPSKRFNRIERILCRNVLY